MEAEKIADGGHTANRRGHADGDIDGVEWRGIAEKLERVGGGAFDELGVKGFDEDGAGLLGELARMFDGGLKVFTMFDQCDALGKHGAVLLAAVAVGNDDDGLETETPGG